MAKKYRKPKMYIAGSITNDKNYKTKFNMVSKYMSNLGYAVFNPALSPEGLTYREYVNLGLEMLMRCDCICIIDGKDSYGTAFEKHYAELVGMPIIEL